MVESDLALVELIPCAALLYSGAGTILAANWMFCELVGYMPDELEHRHITDLATSGERQLDDAVWLTELVTKNGDTIQCEVARKCMNGGGPMQCLALMRKYEGKDDSELIQHVIDEGFILLDRHFRILRINDAALRIDGRPRDAFIGKTHWEAWPGSEQLPIADAYRKAMRERVNVTVEQVYRHHGEDMWLEARAFPVEDGLAVFYRNISAACAGRGKGSASTVTRPSHLQEGASRPLHILLVDRTDDGDELLPAALEAEGHMVALCPDEPSALETARDLHPDAVLIRTDMPGVEGYALARQLRALHPGEHATYIALSDSDQSHDKIIARGAGFDHLLERPVAMGSLRRILS